MAETNEALDAALTKASEELGLQSYYRDCVRPLLTMPETQWPSCCGGNCEPCNQLLVNVARRTRELLDRASQAGLERNAPQR